MPSADDRPGLVIPRTPSFRLDGRRALVVGASSGLGIAAAAALGEAGAEVTLAARSGAKLDLIASALRAEGKSAETLSLDVQNVEAIESVIGCLPAFDILVNSAGLARHGPSLDTDATDFDEVVSTNLRGAYFLTRAVAKTLVAARKPGSLINVSSQMGHVGGIDRAVYSATKHAVEGFTKSMAIEWGRHGIRVNTVCPTFVKTPLAEQTLSHPDRLKWIFENIRLGRLAEVEDVMGAIVFLASDASAMVTGSALMIDGGWTAG